MLTLPIPLYTGPLNVTQEYTMSLGDAGAKCELTMLGTGTFHAEFSLAAGVGNGASLPLSVVFSQVDHGVADRFTQTSDAPGCRGGTGGGMGNEGGHEVCLRTISGYIDLNTGEVVVEDDRQQCWQIVEYMDARASGAGQTVRIVATPLTGAAIQLRSTTNEELVIEIDQSKANEYDLASALIVARSVDPLEFRKRKDGRQSAIGLASPVATSLSPRTGLQRLNEARELMRELRGASPRNWKHYRDAQIVEASASKSGRATKKPAP
ncbi:MAG: hypothetical protein K2X99_01805 [Gemmatimonadaceae bacterium]|nr:hypothetical protein [Gemmatimonadaceae bacterium]